MYTTKNGWELSPDTKQWRYTKDIPENCRVTLITNGLKWRAHIEWNGKGYRSKRWCAFSTAKRNAIKILVFLEQHDEWKATQT